MTSRHEMTRDELLELAALDAYGLLDQYDAAIYTRSFLDAPAAVQNQIREMQAAIAADDSMLPDELPPADLRDKVLAAVRAANEQEASRLAPLATIGRRVAAPAGGTEPEAWSASAPPAGRLRRVIFGGPGQVWRAASFALAGGLLVLVFSYLEVRQLNQEMYTLARANRDLDLLVHEFPTLKVYLGGDSESVLLRRVDPSEDDDAFARVYWMEGETSGHLVLYGLPRTDPRTGKEMLYRLTVTGSDGGSRELRTFGSKGRLSTEPISLEGITLTANSVWAISTITGIEVLRSS